MSTTTTSPNGQATKPLSPMYVAINAIRCAGHLLKPFEVALLTMLASHLDEEGKAWPSMTTLALEAGGKGRTYATNAMRDLEKRKIVKRDGSKYSPRGGSPVTIWVINAAQLKEMAAAQPQSRQRPNTPDRVGGNGPEEENAASLGMTLSVTGNDTAVSLGMTTSVTGANTDPSIDPSSLNLPKNLPSSSPPKSVPGQSVDPLSTTTPPPLRGAPDNNPSGEIDWSYILSQTITADGPQPEKPKAQLGEEIKIKGNTESPAIGVKPQDVPGYQTLEWKRRAETLTVECPHCRTGPGEPCSVPCHEQSGRRPARYSHPSRYEAAGLMDPAPLRLIGQEAAEA